MTKLPSSQGPFQIPSLPKRGGPTAIAVLALALSLSACAIANRGTLQLARHVTVGQELIDLKRALDEGAITEPEYVTLKGKLMELADSIEVSHGFDDISDDDD